MVCGRQKQIIINNKEMQNANQQPIQHPQRYSIFHNPLFQKHTPQTFQRVPFHITFDGDYDYHCVIDHSNNHIETRKSVPKRQDRRTERSHSSTRRIFSEKKKDQSSQLANLSPIELIKKQPSQRESRKHKIFGDYSTINSNDGHYSQNQTIYNVYHPHATNETNTPFVLPEKQTVVHMSSKEQGRRAEQLQSLKKKISVSDQPLNPLQFAKLMFDTRLSQRIKHQRHRQKQETRVLRTLSHQVQAPQMFLR